jgi:CRISPR system Cascade subunit CasD
MSSETMYLALRLQGPLQSWGFDSQYNRRNTGLMPTQSAIAGMCCAALGFGRGSIEEESFLAEFEAVRMTAIAIPRVIEKKFQNNSVKTMLNVRRLQDYHTIQGTRTAEGRTKDCHITYRQFLTDASFGVVLEGNSALLAKIAEKLADPTWGIWLGRKTCIPSAPVLAGLRDSLDAAFRLLLGESPIDSFTRQEEAESFAEGRDSLPDRPMSFASDRRKFLPRRVKTIQGTV